MKKSTLLRISLFIAVSFLGYVYAPQARTVTASASSVWCYMLAPASNPNDCTAGQDNQTCTVVNRQDVFPNCGTGETSDQLKQDLESNLNYFLNSGQPFQKFSANWIVTHALGGSNWVQDLSSPYVTLSVGNVSYTINRAYDPSGPSIQTYADTGTALSLIIKVNGVIKVTIKLYCGNPVGTLNLVNVTLTGRVYYFNTTTRSSTMLTNVPITIDSCDTGNPVTSTNSTGYFSFTLYEDTPFCVSVPSSFSSTPYTNPLITPGNLSGSGGSCGSFSQWYRAQIAYPGSSPGGCSYNITNTQYDIAYTGGPTTGCTTSCCGSTCPTTPPPCTMPSAYIVSINLPNAPQPGNGSAPPPSTSSSPNQTYVQGTPGSFEITAAHDQYNPSPTSISWSPSGYSYNPFSLNYMNYIQLYPYDAHSTTVYYNQQYYMQNWVSSSSPSFYVYSCPSGGTLSGSTCTTTTTSTTTYGATDYSGYWVCDSGGTLSGHTCTITTTSTSSYAATGTPYYDYYPSGSSYVTTSTSTYGGAPVLPELCPRNFEVLPPSNTDVTSVSITANGNTPDQPNQATVSTQTTVKFTLNYWSQLVRNPLSVNGIQYTGNYYIEHADGSQVPIDSPDNQTFNIGSLASPGNLVHPYSTSFAVSLPPLEVGDQICAQFYDTPQSGETDSSGNITNVDSAGPVYSTQIPSPPTCSNSVANYPYSRAYGNDIIAGTNFSNSTVSQCNANASIIASINPDSTAQPRGSGDQFAVLSISQISYYASAFLRSATATAINGLTQANSSGGYGGYYDTGCQSIYNYYLNRNQVPATSVPVNDTQTYGISSNNGTVQLAFSSNGSNNYIMLQANSGNSNTNITGEHVIYVNGNVYIPSNISYNSSGSAYDASSGTVSTVPNLYVIASGNIYIGPNVTQLDGIFVAQNQCDWSLGANCDPYSGSGGIINTCSDPTGVGSVNSTNESDAFPASTLFSNCEQQLTISGALIGHSVKLERTYASMRNSVGGENPIGGRQHNCSAGNGNINPMAPDCSAEIFNFNPVNYLGNPGFSANGYNIDSIISLPPVL